MTTVAEQPERRGAANLHTFILRHPPADAANVRIKSCPELPRRLSMCTSTVLLRRTSAPSRTAFPRSARADEHQCRGTRQGFDRPIAAAAGTGSPLSVASRRPDRAQLPMLQHSASQPALRRLGLRSSATSSSMSNGSAVVVGAASQADDRSRRRRGPEDEDRRVSVVAPLASFAGRKSPIATRQAKVEQNNVVQHRPAAPPGTSPSRSPVGGIAVKAERLP